MRNTVTEKQKKTLHFINKVLDMNVEAKTRKEATHLIDEYMAEAKAVAKEKGIYEE